MKSVYFVLVREQDIEDLVILYAYISEEPAYKNYYMAHVLDTVNNEIIFYQSHTSQLVLKHSLETAIEELGYNIILSYQDHLLPGFQ